MYKSGILRYQRPSRAESLFVQVRESELELLGLESYAQAAQSGFEGPGQSSQDGQDWPIGSVLLSGLWKGLEKTPDSSHVRGQSLYKLQDI